MSARTRRWQRDLDTAEINVTSLIDVMLVLLIFFMAGTSFVNNAEVDIDRPNAKSGKHNSTPTLKVTINRQGRISLYNQTVQPWLLQSRIREKLQQTHGTDVVVISDKNVNTGDVVKVVDECRLAGAKHVAVAVNATN